MGMIQEELLHKVPAPQWPRPSTEGRTVALYAAVMATVATSSALALRLGVQTWPFFILVNAFAVYVSFTVMHEASHKNISRGFPRLEAFMGLTTGLLFHGSYEQFIGIHLRHHAKVNQKGQDPDLHAAGPLGLLTPLKWSATLFVYLAHYLRGGYFRREKAMAVLGPYVFIAAAYFMAWRLGHLQALLCLWLVPSLLGTILTIWVFDHLPHHPHADPGKFTNARFYPHPVLDWAFFMQTHHLVHHLWPSVPWYRYRECYRQREAELLRAGARVERL